MSDINKAEQNEKSIRAAMALKDILKIIKCMEQEANYLARLVKEKNNV